MTLTDRSNSRTDKDRKSNRTSGSSSTRCPGPSSVHSAPIIPYRPIGSPNTCELTSLLDDGSDQSEASSLHESLTHRRRHAVYFHRPPVYVPLQRPDVNTFPMKGNAGSHFFQSVKDRDCCACCQFRSQKDQFCVKCPENRDFAADVDTYLPRSVSEIGIGGYEEQLKCLDTNWVEEPFIVAMANVEGSQDGDRPQGALDDTLPEICTEQDWPNFLTKQDSAGETSETTIKEARPGSQNQSETQKQAPVMHNGEEDGAEISRTFSQIIAGDCARLRSYRDIRLGPDESWVIQEGSLVICLDQKYTDFQCQEQRCDEFELIHGDIFVVCRMYGDMWALCAKVTFSSPVETSSGKLRNIGAPKTFQSLGFLPLCSVTLAANFSSFMRRCVEYDKGPQEEPQTPGNGLAVNPPYRSHSMTASREIFEKSLPKQLQLPSIVFELCGGSDSFDQDGKEFEPLSHQPQDTFKMGTVWKVRSGQLERRMTLKKMWHRLTNSDSSAQAEPPGEGQQQTTAAVLRRVATQRLSETADQTKPLETVERSKTTDEIKAPAVTIQTEGVHKRRKSVRDLLFNSEERLKRNSDRGSGQSDKSMPKTGVLQRENS